MTKYTLKFRYAHEISFLYLTLSSTTLEKSIEESKYFIEDIEQKEYINQNGDRGKYKVVEAYIEKHIERKEVVWQMK